MRLAPSVVVMTLLLSATGIYSRNALAQVSAPVTGSVQCLRGNPDGTFEGDRPVTRYEFAAALDACLQGIEQLIESGDYADRSDFEALLQRQQGLNEELGELGDRITLPTRDESGVQ